MDLLVSKTKALPKKEEVICFSQQYHVKQIQCLIQSSSWVEVAVWSDTITSYLIAMLLKRFSRENCLLCQM